MSATHHSTLGLILQVELAFSQALCSAEFSLEKREHVYNSIGVFIDTHRLTVYIRGTLHRGKAGQDRALCCL